MAYFSLGISLTGGFLYELWLSVVGNGCILRKCISHLQLFLVNFSKATLYQRRSENPENADT